MPLSRRSAVLTLAAGAALAVTGSEAQEATPLPSPVASPRPVKQPTLAADARPQLPASEDLAVLLGTYDGVRLAFLIRNGTGVDAYGVIVNATVRDASGALIAVGQQEGSVAPSRVGPGELGIGSLFFNQAEIPVDATFDLDVRSESQAATPRILDLEVTEIARQDETVIGIVRNPHDVETGKFATLTVGCFTADGQPTGFARSSVPNAYTIAPGGEGPFQVGLPPGVDCETFLVAVTTDSR